MKKLLLIILLLPSLMNAQELNATVTINSEQLQTAARERIENFGQEVETYLNTNRFTEENWGDYKIPCNFNIFLTGSSEETNFRAQVVITSQRPVHKSQKNSLMMKVQDSKWSFTYEKNQALYFNQADFNPLTSFLDFYAYLIIGFDSDSYNPMGGNDYFLKAFEIATLGGSQTSDGWNLSSDSYNKRMLVENISNAMYQEFRKDYFIYHYHGLDQYSSNKREAQKKIAGVIQNLSKNKDKIDPRSVLMRVYFEAKSGEIVDYLSDYPDKTIFEVLKKIDPAHISKYDKALGY